MAWAEQITHEVGQWLNLDHVRGNGGCSAANDDLVADTPRQNDENYGYPNFPQVECSSGPNGVMFYEFHGLC